ncbi:argininosuccinate synthase [Enterocloster aldenensis]|uniref:InlB B-repeat-containing protein n=1 Tax=Enterocloster aldenensis TaxID=358742 RepID=UPI000E4717F3|nr:argininosuccinate synthase [Enterocloster aldenensis]
MIKNIKSKLAGVLAAAMVISMAAPVNQVYAIGYGETSKLKFDPQDGPGMSLTSYSAVASGDAMEQGVFVATGQAGHPLTSSDNFAGLPNDDFGSGPRPKVPDFNNVTWDGYTFDGWYAASGKKVETLPYAFPYEASTTYKAVWKGNDDTPYTFRVEHYRDFNPTRGEASDSSGWPSDYNDPDLRKFYETNWNSTQMANNPISATYRRDIPGYMFTSVLIKNNKVRKYGEPLGGGTMTEGGAAINSATHAVKGNMPNDNLTVAYRYEPNDKKTFPITIRYVDKNGDQIKAPDTMNLPVEADYAFDPPAITSYLPESVSLTNGGVTDLEGRGIISASDAGCSVTPHNGGNTHVTGTMPNQAIEFTYKYKDDDNFEIKLQVNYMDNHKNSMEEAAGLEDVNQVITANTPYTIPVPDMDGYVYPPNIKWDPSLAVDFDKDTEELTVTSNIQGGAIEITYNEDLSDTGYWAKVEFYNGENGSFGVTPASKFIKKAGGITLSQVTDGIELNPSPHYRVDGWYEATSNGSDKQGPKLAEDMVISRSIKLYANFVEQEGDWFDLRFAAGDHGSISGNKTMHVVKNTLWTDLDLPDTDPDTFYQFDGWFDEMGNRVQSSQTIMSDQTYTARFVPIGVQDDGIPAMPDAYGSVGSNGSGKVTVAGVNEDRRYALTDMDREVLEIKPGTQLKNSGFTGLRPSASYYVYELLMTANPLPGATLPDNVDPGTCSPPTRVTVPALGNNYKVMDGADGTMQVVVEPADPQAVYAILTMEGDVINVPDSDGEGWVTPEGSPGRAVLGGLEGNQLYVVVAKQPGEDTEAADKLLLGTQVSVVGSSQADEEYTITLTNGGYITKIKRLGVSVDFDDTATAVVRAGDKITFDTDPVDSQGQTFKQWSGLIGRFTLEDKTRRNPTITMPEGNLVIQADYNGAASAATPGNASVDYTPKNGSVALDLSTDLRSDLIDGLTNNTSDQDAMADGIDVGYTVKFSQRPPKASESNAVKEEVGDEAVKVPWTLTSSLTRQVGGANKDIPAGVDTTPDIRVFASLDRSMYGYIDYRLWNLEDLDENPTCTSVDMEPDPNDEDSGFSGVVSFDAKVGSTYVLTYLKAYGVKIIDPKRAALHMVKVKTDTPLEDGGGFLDLPIFEDYTDPITGIVYEYRGLGRTPASSNEYDITEPVKKNMTLYVLYDQTDDSEWQEARQKLMDQITIAQALKDDPAVDGEDRDALEDAIDIALEVANRVYRPTLDEMVDTYNMLKDLVDSITSEGDNPDTPDTPDNPDTPDTPDNPDNPDTPDTPDTPDRPGGGGGGSARAGGGGGRILGPGFSFNNYRTFSAGTEGSWQTVGGDPAKWQFILNRGTPVKDQWANVKYGGTGQAGTYHFNKEGIMDYGWYMDDQGEWYYLNEAQGPVFGSMVVGWYLDAGTNKWYYLNEFTGAMATGWQKLGEDWYYLNPVSQEGRPRGTLYVDGMTPDGYPVDENGKWIRETP